jgi:hypothetical protein
MHGICKPFQVNFHVLPFKKNLQNTSRFVTLFSAHGDVVVRFAIFHIVYSKKKRKNKKGTPPLYVNVGGHPMESVSRGLRKEKRWGGVPSFIKEHQSANLSQKLASFLYGR